MKDGLAVLSIEDSEADFRLIELALRRSGRLERCRRVDNREALLAALAENHWDVVLSDYSLPALGFTEILAHFRKHRPDLPLILVSGTIGEVKAAAMLQLGTTAFVSKDNLDALVPTILRQVERRETF